MRISTIDERPTVSIQNGRPICLRISSDSASSSCEKNGFGSWRRQLRSRQEIDDEAEPVLRDAAQLGVVGVLRKGLVDVDERRDLLRHRRRQIIRHQIPVPLHEHESDHRLQHHHRHDDDQERTGIEPLRHHRFEPAAEAVPRSGDRPRHRGRGAGHGARGGGHMDRPQCAIVRGRRLNWSWCRTCHDAAELAATSR